jgi:hypothetical protein
VTKVSDIIRIRKNQSVINGLISMLEKRRKQCKKANQNVGVNLLLLLLNLETPIHHI